MKKRLIIVACSVFILWGCGQKGPLYLPKDAPQESADHG
ncbi:lipoprotein [Suttonella sp. R2A3]|nr:lipoprotein [Suttonella sp. R2A3]UJF24785.1 lipoprotein [Suttonella sp. R2A3]